MQALPEKRCTHCYEPKGLDEFGKHPATRDGRQSWCKACTRGASRKTREEYPERVKAACADWYQRNRDAAIAASRERYRTNRVALVADEQRRRAARRANGIKPRVSDKSLARQREYMSQWTRRNAERINAYHRAYYASGKGHGYQHARKARILGNGGMYTATEWAALCATYNQRCLACGEQRPLTVDHVVPLARGGQNVIGNIQPLCKSCNSRKHLQAIDYRLAVGTR